MARTKPLTVNQFFEQFPDDDACLEHLFQVRYGDNPQCPRCGEEGRFHKLAKLPAYTCNCGHHIHPMVGTPFHRSRTPLQKWFYAMYLFTTTRNGVSAKEIQRQLGVTYKCAWRMAGLIRDYMGWVDGDAPIGGPHNNIVEADEVMIGGHDKRGHDDKTLVMGVAERGAEIVTRVVPDRSEATLVGVVAQFVRPASRLATDNARAFRDLRRYGYSTLRSTMCAASTFVARSTRIRLMVSGRGSSAPLPAPIFGCHPSTCKGISASSNSASIFGSNRTCFSLCSWLLSRGHSLQQPLETALVALRRVFTRKTPNLLQLAGLVKAEISSSRHLFSHCYEYFVMQEPIRSAK